MLGLYLVLILLIIVVIIAMCAVTFLLSAYAVRFSRVTLGLLIGVVLMQSDFRLAEQNFLNFVAWAIIGVGIIFALSAMPRLDRALKFVSNLLISFLTAGILIMLGGGIVCGIAGTEFSMNIVFELILKIGCLAFAVVMMIADGKKKPFEYSKSVFVSIIERAIASLMYGFALLIVCSSIGNNYVIPEVLEWVLFGVFVVGTYIADIYLQKHPLAIMEEEKPVYMPR